MISDEKKLSLEKQGYRLVGNHSAIKVCMWTKRAIKCQDVCYKNTFYGIQTEKCVQMTPALPVCNQRCQWCWRDINWTKPEWDGPIDDPKSIVDGCVEAHIKYLQGFGGNADANNFESAMKPKHFAISLSGEPTMYPKLPELIDEIHRQDMTTFLVTNGTFPDMIRKLKGHEPTQLYITVHAPNEELYVKSTNPLFTGGWSRLMESLEVQKSLDCRTVMRLTLVKGLNMVDPEEYAKLFIKSDMDFLEMKGYVWVGHSRERLKEENMPSHEEIVEFSKKIVEANPSLKIIDEKPNSRVVLVMKEDFDGRIMKF